jgi:hypothetical protein
VFCTTWARKSQKVREGGKEPVVRPLSEGAGQRQPRPTQVFEFVHGITRYAATPCRQHALSVFHGVVSLWGAGGNTPSIYTCTFCAWHNASKDAMKKKTSTAKMERRYARLTQRLAKLGPVLQGTITERTIVRDDPQAPGKEKNYGPYFQWTFKRNGKTVTVNLTASQAKTYQRAINHHRRMEKILDEMRALSLEILEKKTKSVKKRTPRQ